MIETFNEISQRMIKGIMYHEQWADLFDFLNFRGFKRQQEYRFLKENAELRGVHRYTINHCNKLINDKTIDSVKEIPETWYNYTKLDVDNNIRKQYVKDIFKKWHTWETETKKFYEEKFKQLTDNGRIASANKVNELIKNVDKELKCLTRQVLEYQSVDWDLEYLMWQQDCIHDEYEEKEKQISVNIC